MIRDIPAGKLTASQSGQVVALLEACDTDFVPPLSSRCSVTQEEFADTHASEFQCDGMPAYYRAIIEQQPCLLATMPDTDGVVGILSYIPRHIMPAQSGMPGEIATYVSTVCVAKDKRGHGIGRALYDGIIAKNGTGIIATRTWGTNDAQLSLLSSLGFVVTAQIPDDRGKHIDTMYLALDHRSQ